MKYSLLVICSVLLLFGTIFSCDKSSSSGKALYNQHCANCHLENGQGLGALIPTIVNSEPLGNNDLLACMIRNGIKAESEANSVFEGYAMPPNKALSEIEITNIINYARSSFSSSTETISLPEVKNALQTCN